MSAQKSKITPEIIELYEKLIATHPKINRKGKTMPYTSVNGHMFSLLTKDGKMGLRLNEHDQEEFIKKYNSKILEQYGRRMK